MFDLWYYNLEFSTGHLHQSNPLNSLVMVDDLIVPIDSLPEHMQQMEYQASAVGNDIACTSDYQDE